MRPFLNSSIAGASRARRERSPLDACMRVAGSSGIWTVSSMLSSLYAIRITRSMLEGPEVYCAGAYFKYLINNTSFPFSL